MASGDFGTPTNWDALPLLMDNALAVTGICGSIPATDVYCTVRKHIRAAGRRRARNACWRRTRR